MPLISSTKVLYLFFFMLWAFIFIIFHINYNIKFQYFITILWRIIQIRSFKIKILLIFISFPSFCWHPFDYTLFQKEWDVYQLINDHSKILHSRAYSIFKLPNNWLCLHPLLEFSDYPSFFHKSQALMFWQPQCLPILDALIKISPYPYKLEQIILSYTLVVFYFLHIE